MADNSAYLAFLRDPDQEQRRAELAAFFGPNAPVFLKSYETLRETTAQSPSGRAKFGLLGGGFSTAAFFLGPVWFFYRKMWLLAWVIVGILAVVAFVPALTRGGLAVSVILALMARRAYVQHAITKLQALRSAEGTLDPETVRAVGGVSKQAGTISGIIFGLLWIAGVASVIYLASHGVDPR